MKKLLLGIFLLSVSVTAISARELKEAEVSSRVLNTFHTEFTGAQKVNWQEYDDIYQAIFVYKEERISAYFDAEGQLLATTRNIFQKQLPFIVARNLERQYKDYYVLSVVERCSPGAVDYIIMVEKDGQKSLLNANVNGSIHRVKKIQQG